MPSKIVSLSEFSHRGGFCFTTPIGATGDSLKGAASPTRLFEDGIEIGPAHTAHTEIEESGGGRFSHWDKYVYFSSSDGTSPISNGRCYQAILESVSESRTAIDKNTFLAIQSGVLKYLYKGVWCCKSPIDMALYQMLIWKEGPRTILELGTLEGGSALWFADILRTFKVDGHVHSLDIASMPDIRDPLITFYRGDILHLADVWSKEFIAALPRPILVVEDAGHQYEMTRAAIEYMAGILQQGEYLIVEDGIATPMDSDRQFNGGPLRAIDEFLASHQGFVVDRSYCDFFGKNVTWNIDGFLRKL